MSFRRDKRAAVGNFIVMYWSTIIIVFVLFLFIFGSGLVKKISEVDEGVSIYNETRTGLTDVLDYIPNYQKFVEAKVLIEGGVDLDVALAEVEYEK